MISVQEWKRGKRHFFPPFLDASQHWQSFEMCEIYWDGQEVHSSFPLTSYTKIQMNFLANPIFRYPLTSFSFSLFHLLSVPYSGSIDSTCHPIQVLITLQNPELFLSSPFRPIPLHPLSPTPLVPEPWPGSSQQTFTPSVKQSSDRLVRRKSDLNDVWTPKHNKNWRLSSAVPGTILSIRQWFRSSTIPGERCYTVYIPQIRKQAQRI